MLDDRLQSARDADPITAHDGRVFFARFVQETGVESLAVFCSELEHVSDLNRAADFQRLAAMRAWFAGRRQPQIAPLVDSDVAGDINVAQMEAVFVCARGHFRGPLQRFIRANLEIPCPDRAEASGVRF